MKKEIEKDSTYTPSISEIMRKSLGDFTKALDHQSVNKYINPLIAEEIPSMSMLTSSGNPSMSVNEHVEQKYLTDAYCTHLALKNKFVDKYDSLNFHQIPDDTKEKSVDCNKENLQFFHVKISNEVETRSPSKLIRDHK